MSMVTMSSLPDPQNIIWQQRNGVLGPRNLNRSSALKFKDTTHTNLKAAAGALWRDLPENYVS